MKINVTVGDVHFDDLKELEKYVKKTKHEGAKAAYESLKGSAASAPEEVAEQNEEK